MSGALIKDIEYQVKQEVNKLTLSGLMYPYGGYLATGVSKDKIPFSPRSMGFKASKAGTSKYIEGLQNYAKQRMGISDDKKSLGVAFAIAQTQKKYGMPTPASVFYSKTGQRTEFIAEAFKKNEDRIKAAIASKIYIGVVSQSFWVVPIAFACLRDDRDIRDSRKG
jgi:hypothetical protein